MCSKINRMFSVSMMIILLVTASLYAPKVSQAMNKPEIVRHEAHLLGSSVNFNVHWQSPNPVSVVTISVSGVSKTIKVDEYDNKRNQDGYWGELTANFNLSQVVSFDGRSIMYLVTLEDDLRQKSEQVQGKVVIASKPPGDDRWGAEYLSGTQVQQAPPYQQPTVNVSLPQIGVQGTIQMDPTKLPVPSSGTVTYSPAGSQSNVLIEVVPTGITRQRMFSITINTSTPANQLRWYVADLASGKAIFDPLIITPFQNNVFWTDPVTLQLGSYRMVVQPIFASGAQTSEMVKEFIIDDK